MVDEHIGGAVEPCSRDTVSPGSGRCEGWPLDGRGEIPTRALLKVADWVEW